MPSVYGEMCLSNTAVYNWVKKFSQCHSKIVDEDRSGHPVLIPTKSTEQQVEELIQADRRETIDSNAMKQPFGSKQFADDDDVQPEVLLWITQQPKEFYTAGIGALIK
ncbi:hypothetical protein TNIN_210081 [Trichonephila inaurata madagascariensis]|uniref:Transposase n=1 Tax=Trichonephila inaurata madagascariensis TaxID=2747483 RepID=A0A8X7CCA9_9ARAC|nr:hypothetical protein TNIN_210081 [Trichonephila inaurata madagascariensis]